MPKHVTFFYLSNYVIFLFLFFLQNVFKNQRPLEDNESVLCLQTSYVVIFNRTKMFTLYTFQILHQVFKVDIHQK